MCSACASCTSECFRHVRVKRGSRFVTGESIGTVNAFNHVHLNVGWPGEEVNPLRLRLVRFEDRRQSLRFFFCLSQQRSPHENHVTS